MAKGIQQPKEPTKKQIALSRRQKKERRRILIGVGVVTALVVGIAVAGLLDQLVIQPSRPVAIVHDARIRTDTYQDRVRYERLILDGILSNIQLQLATMDPNDPNSTFIIQYYEQIRQQINQQRLGVDQQALQDLVDEELVRLKAAELGLAVSEDELNEEIRSRIANQSGFVTEAQATVAVSTAQAATATAQTFTPTPIPTATPTLTITTVTTDTPVPTLDFPTPAPTATPHIITNDEFSQQYSRYLETINDQAGISESEFREIVRAELLTQKVANYFADQVPAEAMQVNVSHIQVDTEEEAQAVLGRLDGGEDFALVASEVSTDTFTAENGGELGWFPEGDLTLQYGADFEEAAFSLNPGEYSQPIASASGWHIIQVNDRGLRALDSYQLQSRQQQAYFDWLAEARSAEGIEILLEPDMVPPDPLLDSSSG